MKSHGMATDNNRLIFAGAAPGCPSCGSGSRALASDRFDRWVCYGCRNEFTPTSEEMDVILVSEKEANDDWLKRKGFAWRGLQSDLDDHYSSFRNSIEAGDPQ